MRKRVLCLVAIAGVACAPAAFGQGTITDNTVSFDWNSFGGTGAVTDYNVAGSDHSFQTDFWHRIGGAGQETLFGAPTSQNYAGDTATFTYNLANGVTATLVSVIQEVVANQSAIMFQTLTINNNSGRDLAMSMFHYQDYDVGGTFGDDSAVLQATNNMLVTDGGSNDFADYFGPGASAWEVEPFPMLRNRLNDAAVDNWGNSGLPFGPADFTGSFQWDLSIPEGGSATIRVGLSINTPVPAPGALALLGIAGLAVRRRRRA